MTRHAMEYLNTVIEEMVSNIQEYSVNPDRDFKRNRKLGAETLVRTILNMQGNSLNAELYDLFPNMEDRMSASAFVQSRGKLKAEFFYALLKAYNETFPTHLGNNHKGYQVYAIDGTDFNLPYNPKSKYVFNNIGRPRKDGTPNKSVSMAHANICYDILNQVYIDCKLQPKSKVNEREDALTMLRELSLDIPTIFLMDRGYDGLNMIENFNRKANAYYVIRVKVGSRSIQEFRDLPDTTVDMPMSIGVTTNTTLAKELDLHYINAKKYDSKGISKNSNYAAWDFGERCTVNFRVVKFFVGNSWEVLVTNLPKNEFSTEDMKELYHKRWGIETSFRNLKYSIGAVQFHSKTDEYIHQEIYAHLVMYNLIARSIAETSVECEDKAKIKTEDGIITLTGKKYAYKIEFKMACKVIKKFFRTKIDILKIMFCEIASYLQPIREGRQDIRNLNPKSSVPFLYRVA